ncbi:MAG TPA: DNA repair protein RadC [Chitinispirillaceae bacterium]|nr:DNA repair protein RadC [Chitinispirillaceae bacterium]
MQNLDASADSLPEKDQLPPADLLKIHFDSSCGHRSRLLQRYIGAGIDSLHLHEIVELLLTYAIPRRDTKQIAHQLVTRFKTISSVLNASEDELIRINGITTRSATLFHLLRDVMAICLKERYEKQDLITHRRDVEEYLRFYFGHRKDEYVAAIFLDNSNHILQTEIVAEGTVNQCAVYPRLIIERALRCSATSMIIAHNHPGGALTPSEADWLITERIFTIGKMLELPLIDHIIISHHKVISLRDLPRWPV